MKSNRCIVDFEKKIVFLDWVQDAEIYVLIPNGAKFFAILRENATERKARSELPENFKYDLKQRIS